MLFIVCIALAVFYSPVQMSLPDHKQLEVSIDREHLGRLENGDKKELIAFIFGERDSIVNTSEIQIYGGCQAVGRSTVYRRGPTDAGALTGA
jgi:hypothetical protein